MKAKMRHPGARIAISAMLIAISLVINELLKFDLPFLQGGSITLCSMVPLVLIGWVWGPLWGFGCGCLMGLIDMLIGGLGNFAWVTGLLPCLMLILFDYLIAYGAIGLAGLARRRIRNRTAAIGIGAAVGCFLRFVCHFLTGVTIWRDVTNDLVSSVVFSVTYNGAYMLPELIITVVGCCAVAQIKPLMDLLERQ